MMQLHGDLIGAREPRVARLICTWSVDMRKPLGRVLRLADGGDGMIEVSIRDGDR